MIEGRLVLFIVRLQTVWVRSLSEGLEQLRQKEIWAAFASLDLPDSRPPQRARRTEISRRDLRYRRGLRTLDRLLDAAPTVPILVMAAATDLAVVNESLPPSSLHGLPTPSLYVRGEKLLENGSDL